MFLLEGEATLFSEDGIKKIKAPFFGITKAGTKRVVYMNSETLCVTIHRTDAVDIKSAEDDIWAKSFEELGIAYEMERV